MNRRWMGPISLLALLIALNVLSLTDRFLLAAFGTQIVEDLNLSHQQFGLLTGFGFVLFYALAGPITGLLADRFGASRILTAGIVLWSAMTALTGQAKGFIGMMIPRAFVGIGEATLNPAATAVLSRAFDSQHRAVVLGLYFMGGHIGVALAYQIAGIPSIEWRGVFTWLGVIGIGMAGLLVAFARSMPDTLGRPESAESKGSTSSVKGLIGELLTHAKRNTTLQLAILGMALLHLIYAEIQFMQIWLASERGYSPDEASALYGQVYLLTSVPAALLGGALADLMARHPSFNRASFVVAVIILTLPLVFLFRIAEPGSALFLTGMVASVALFTLPYGAMIAIILDQVPDDIKASTTALTMFTVNVLIIGSATYFLGLASDIFASIDVDEPMSSALLIMDTLLILSLVAYARLHSKLKAAS